MPDVETATRDLLADHPDSEAAFREILAVDDDGPWSFHDLDVESGRFGEIVSRGIVAEGEGGYRVVNREAVIAAIEGDRSVGGSDTSAETDRRGFLERVATDRGIDRQFVAAVLGSLLLVVLARVLYYGSVFRNGDIVLAGNDPWGYRYWVEELLRADVGAFDIAGAVEVLGGGLAQDFLFVIVSWWFALLLGGDAHAAGLALAWYPVLAALATAVFVYLIATRLSRDRRVGLAAVALLALTPVHAYRSMIGFGDHHAFDYLWIAVTLYAVVVLASTREWRAVDMGSYRGQVPATRTSWLAAIPLGVGVAGQVLAWRGGPLLILPVAGYAVYRAVSDQREGRSPLGANAPLVLGLALAAAFAFAPYALWDAVSYVRAISPALVLGGTIAVLTLGAVGHRLELSTRSLVASAIIASVVGLQIVVFVAPFSTVFQRGVRYFQRTGQSGIAETFSIFSGEVGTIVGPILFFGFLLFLALPYIGLALWWSYREHEPAWFAVGAYGVYLLVLATVQLRFAGQLSVVTGVLGGIGFVHLAGWVDLARVPRLFEKNHRIRKNSSGQFSLRRSLSFPGRRRAITLVLLFCLMTSLALVQIPIKQGQLAIDADTYETATWLEGYADETAGDYPDNYVFSQWGRNRAYNYIVNGKSRNYTYAKYHYYSFLASSDSHHWYDRLQNRSGFIVATAPPSSTAPESIHNRLYRHLGSASEQTRGLSHYRFVHTSDGGRRVFDVVSGATIVGENRSPSGSVSIRSRQTVSNTSFVYERQVQPGVNGWYAITVPYPGQYTGDREFSVSETSIQSGEFLVNQTDRAHWPLEAGRERVAFDTVGGNHGRIFGATWVSTEDGQALSFDGNDSVVVKHEGRLWNDSFTLTARFKTLDSVDYVNESPFLRIASTAPSGPYWNTSGYQITMSRGHIVGIVGNGTATTRIDGPRIDDGQWHNATLTKQQERLVFYVDGIRIGTKRFDGEIQNDQPFVIGSSSDRDQKYKGFIDSVRFNNTRG